MLPAVCHFAVADVCWCICFHSLALILLFKIIEIKIMYFEWLWYTGTYYYVKCTIGTRNKHWHGMAWHGIVSCSKNELNWKVERKKNHGKSLFSEMKNRAYHKALSSRHSLSSLLRLGSIQIFTQIDAHTAHTYARTIHALNKIKIN